jgi:acetyl esterase/lipase
MTSLFLLGSAVPESAQAQTQTTPPIPSQGKQFKDLSYATLNGKSLGLDLYLPPQVKNPALIVWVHGGAWRTGDKSQYPQVLVDQGFALASLDFRQSTEARFPAAVHDIKAAIRYLRAVAGNYGYRTERIAISGASSGGHLAALVGLTNGNRELEGTVGDHLRQSSSVQAIISYFGASNLTTIIAQSTPFGLNIRRPALDLLLGAQPDQVPELARLASPVAHVSKESPPLLLFHGEQDPQMPPAQSLELEGAYKKSGRDVALVIVYGAAHSAKEFFVPEHVQRATQFLERTLGES